MLLQLLLQGPTVRYVVTDFVDKTVKLTADRPYDAGEAAGSELSNTEQSVHVTWNDVVALCQGCVHVCVEDHQTGLLTGPMMQVKLPCL
jgi:hypothetical protein